MNKTNISEKQSVQTQAKESGVRLLHSTPRSEFMTNVDMEIQDLDRRLTLLREEKKESTFKEIASEKQYKSMHDSAVRRDEDACVAKDGDLRTYTHKQSIQPENPI